MGKIEKLYEHILMRRSDANVPFETLCALLKRLGFRERVKGDGFVKSPPAALRGILRHCGVSVSTPHSSEFARLASGAFYFAIPNEPFYDFIKGDHHIFTKDGVEEILNLQPKDSKGKPYQVKQVRDIILNYQIRIGE